jgi:hypothetical protein
VVPISRQSFLKRFFDGLNNLIVPDGTKLITYVDGDLRLFEQARNFTHASQFTERLCVYRNKGIPSVSDYRKRRQRISDIHNEIKNSVQTEYVFLTEDDTLLPPDALQVLSESYKNMGYISGIQVGRWGWLSLGAWKNMESIPLGEGLTPVDAAGMYCLLTKTENYQNHHFKPYKDILGPDVDFGLALANNYVHQDVRCGHMTLSHDIWFDNVERVRINELGECDKIG